MKWLYCSHSDLPPPLPPASSFSSLQHIASSQPKDIPKVILKKGKTQLFKDGSPMVYSGAVDRIIGRPPPNTGDIVLVADGTEKPIGWGLYNSVSMFCVRLMQLEEEATRDPSCALDMEKLLETRINAAIELCRGVGLPSTSTNAYRLINSEGDRLSGLIVDVFGDLAVASSSAAWVEKYKSQVEACISSIDEINHIHWRPSVEILKEGMESADLKELHPSTCPQRTKDFMLISVKIKCSYQRFHMDREFLMFAATVVVFALNAAKGGAMSITGVDTSLPALELARENIVLNNWTLERHPF
ncbi:putative cyclin-B3-1-like isoform X2 [Hibiscus syriacus]|uniref:Cyclin-B3-1-like isoform X2 n=1 Tax=Hibiscus syriacus TaxID=106335 RepID=A0A6A3AQ27_HIBSY|nr:putative cyclin-B3-1-like isoform X2 [Hibiscus syriacus]